MRDPLPPHAHVVSYAPFDALVHHSGIGIPTQALAASLPQTVLPSAHDQFDNATRLVKRGVAPRLTAGSSAWQWAKTLGAETVLGEICRLGAGVTNVSHSNQAPPPVLPM